MNTKLEDLCIDSLMLLELKLLKSKTLNLLKSNKTVVCIRKGKVYISKF